jgi:flagellin-like hook-associated protein FlgL
LAGGVKTIYSVGNAFAALKTDASVVTWGDSTAGGDSSAVSAQLSFGVQAIYGTQSAFAALKTDGSVVTWGDSTGGGDSSAVAGQLTSGVQSLSSPFDEEVTASASSSSGNGAQIVMTSAEAIAIGGAQRSSLGFAASTQPSGTLAGMRTTSVAEATETIQRVDVALQSIAMRRARVGATHNRFHALIDAVNTASSNLAAARSRITDADVAAETAALTRAQILQQAGQAMLAQANTNQRQTLALLLGER